MYYKLTLAKYNSEVNSIIDDELLANYTLAEDNDVTDELQDAIAIIVDTVAVVGFSEERVYVDKCNAFKDANDNIWIGEDAYENAFC